MEVTETPRSDEKGEIAAKEEVIEQGVSASESKAASVAADPSFTSVFDIEPPFKECSILMQAS